jgi:hypothetical protein
MQSTMQGLVDAGDVAGLNAITYHFVQTCWKQLGIDFGGALHGVHAATPSEPLHQIDIGIFKYEIKELFLAIGSKDCKLWSVIDEWVRRIGRYLLHQSDRELPRTYFPNGVSAGTKLAGHKHIGVLVLVLHIMLKMKAPCNAIINSTHNQMTGPKLDRWCKVFGLQLAWRAWLKRDTISMAEVTVSTLGHKRLMGYLKRYAPRTLKMGWQIIKFHMILHMTRYIVDFGVPANVDTSTIK